MRLRLLYHGHCFDGVASAATFTRFYKERIHPEAEVNYTGLLHRPGNLFDLTMFDSDENAIVDFKYAASDKLTWWFDHHESAFLTPEDEAHFRADRSGRKFLDATRKSCTEFIADGQPCEEAKSIEQSCEPLSRCQDGTCQFPDPSSCK